MRWQVLRPTPNGLRRTEHIDQETGEIIRLFKIETELRRIGVEHYAPSETKFIRNPKNLSEWMQRRFSLMPYVFLAGQQNWMELERHVKESWGPLRKDSQEIITIPHYEIERLKAAQLQIDTAHAMTHRNAQLTKARLKELYPTGSTVEILTGPFATQKAVVLAATGRRTIKAMISLLGGEVAAELSIDDVREAAQ